MNKFPNDTIDDDAPNPREQFIQLAIDFVSQKEYDSLNALIIDIETIFANENIKVFSRSQAYKILEATDIKLVDENGTGNKILKYTGTPILNSIISPQGYFRRIYFTIEPSYGKLFAKCINSHYDKKFLNAIALENMLICFYKPRKAKKKDKSGDTIEIYKPSSSTLRSEIIELLDNNFFNLV